MFLQKIKQVYTCNNTNEKLRYTGKIRRIGKSLCSYHLLTNIGVYNVTDDIKSITSRDDITPTHTIKEVCKILGVSYE